MSIIKTLQTATSFAQKKLLGKAHTSNLFSDSAESIGTSVQASSLTLFGEEIPDNPTKTLWNIDGPVEYIEFDLVPLDDSVYDANDTGGGAGSGSGEANQQAGAHAYAFRLPSNYTTNSSNPNKGTGGFTNSKILHETGGKVQIVPPNFSQNNAYEIAIFKSNGNQIPLLSTIDWQVDTYSGILFVQDYDSNTVPSKAKAFAYIGKKVKEVVDDASNAVNSLEQYFQSNASGFLTSTGSLALSGQEGDLFNSSDIGNDAFFFVSGSIGGKDSGEGVSVFGGDLVISGNLLLPSESTGLIDSQEIRHQYIDQEYSGSYTTNIEGKLFNKSLKSPVYAKSNDINSDLFNVLRFSLYSRSQAAFELLLTNKSVFKEIAYIDDGSGNFTQANNYFNFSFDKSIGYLNEVIDENTGEASYVNEDVDTNDSASYFFDSQGPQALEAFTRNGVSKQYASFAAEVNSNFNHGFKYILQEYGVDQIKSSFETTLGLTGTNFTVTYTANTVSGTQEVSRILITDSNNSTLYDFSPSTNYQIYLANEPVDVTKKVLNDINNTTLISDYRSTIIAGGVTPPGTGKISNRYRILFSKYLNEGTPEYIKIGTKVSVNRWEELKTKFSTFDISASIINAVFKPTSSSDNNPLINYTTLFGCLKTIIYAYNYAITNSSAVTKPDALNSTNYPSFNWSLFDEIEDATNNLELYDLRLLLVTSLKSMIDDAYIIFNATLNDAQYSDFLSYSATVRNFSNNVSSKNTSTTISNILSNTFSAEIGFNLNRKLNGTSGVYTLVKEYDEYLFYKALHFNSVGDESERDFVITNNRGVYNATTDVLDAENSSSNKESLIKNRYTILSAFKPALIANGTSLFLGPVSISKLYGQSPIQVNTEFVFGNTQPFLDEDGNFLTGSEGEVITTSSNLLKIGSKGFEGDLQVTGSIDITGFGSADGMRINMGNLVMTNDQDGFNMPQFNMVNTNAEPYERPQILLSNNLSSFVQGETGYQMGELSFAGPRDDSPADDKENITVYGQINEHSGSQVNYLGFQFYINEDRNLTGSLGTVHENNKKRQILTLGQFGTEDSVKNQFGVSVGMGLRGNILPLNTENYSSGGLDALGSDSTLGNDRYRWGGLFLDNDRKIEFGPFNNTNASIFFNSSTNNLDFQGRSFFQNGLTGSLTQLTDGTSYIKGEDGITVTTGSKGEVVISRIAFDSNATNQVNKTSDTGLTGSIVQINQSVFESAGYDDNKIKLYVNGQLNHSGSLSQVNDSSRDYFIDQSNNSVYFSYPIESDDIISTTYHEDVSDNRGQFRYDRFFSVDQPAGTNVWFNFDFNLIDNDYRKFDVYLNGELLARNDSFQDSDQPYKIASSNRLVFDSDIYTTDVVSLVFKIPNPNTQSGEADDDADETAAPTRFKVPVLIAQSFSPMTDVSFSNLDFDLDIYSKDLLTVFLNGNLILSGSEYNVNRGQFDYAITGPDTVKFGGNLAPEDTVTFDLLLPGSTSAFNETIFVTANRSLLSNSLQLAGTGSITSYTESNKIIIKNTKEIVFNEVLSGSANGSNQIFELNNDPFDSEEISIFVNGALKTPQHVSNNYDYSVSGRTINFSASSTPISGSLVLAIYNKVT